MKYFLILEHADGAEHHIEVPSSVDVKSFMDSLTPKLRERVRILEVARELEAVETTDSCFVLREKP